MWRALETDWFRHNNNSQSGSGKHEIRAYRLRGQPIHNLTINYNLSLIHIWHTVIASREAVRTALQALGFEVLPSAANFLFARHPRRDAAELAAALRQKSVIVRHFRQSRIEQFLRITVGNPAQNAALLAALGEILEPRQWPG